MARHTQQDLTQELAQLRSEVSVLRAAVAYLSAEVARNGDAPADDMGAFVIRMLGYAEAASKHLGKAASRTMRATDEMLRWAEMLLQAGRPRDYTPPR